jgi:hypothetical protein
MVCGAAELCFGCAAVGICKSACASCLHWLAEGLRCEGVEKRKLETDYKGCSLAVGAAC